MIPLSSKNGEYIGSLSQIAPGIFMGAAHVVSRLSENELSGSLRAQNIDLQRYRLYQYTTQTSFLDVVVLLPEPSQPADYIAQMMAFAPALSSGDEYSLVQVSNLNGQLVRQNSSGRLSLSIDKTALYLPYNNDNYLTWGSSGSIVFTKSSKTGGQWLIGGVVQCYVVNQNKTDHSEYNPKNYFKAISAEQILNAKLVPSRLTEIQSRQQSNISSDRCDPVGGKDGGG